MKKLKTLFGRLIRIFERKTQSRSKFFSSDQISKIEKIRMIYNQSCLSGSEKKKYKEDNKVLYSFHAPEALCIGKGKLHKPYEFGNKVSIAVSGRNNFVLSAKSFQENIYDGHTL